ncbi:MAG: hypothetical protein EBU90_07110 [Proteobacteria bacterium]|nr:hypothetical protein [Pseudomonadota bacterium]NBP14183.1 hypothetical protein [bacterium]
MGSINVTITSTFGYVNSTGTIIGPTTYFKTIFDFQSSSTGFLINDSKLLAVSTITPFTCFPNQDSEIQTVYFYNNGVAPLTITSLLFTADSAIPQITYGPGWGSISTTIDPGVSKYFDLSYRGTDLLGDFYNSITIGSNNDQGIIRLATQQTVAYGFNWNYSPGALSEGVTEIGQPIEHTFLISPDSKSLANGLLINTFGVSDQHSGGWEVVDYAVLNQLGHIKVRFDPDKVANATGTYVQTLTVYVNGIMKTIENTATVNITFTNYLHLIDWVSPIASSNSVIGLSYDIENNEKCLKIGVGLGGDGTPVYDQGGAGLLDIGMLGINADTLDYPYAHWAEVYRVEGLGSGTSRTMSIGKRDQDGEYVYKVKSTDGLNYGDYFGNGSAKGSMFTVVDDGTGNLLISINGLREISGSQDFDDTLHNLSRAFYYYSEADTGTRYTNLPQYPIDTSPSTGTVKSPYNETRTRIFRGFTGNGNTWTTATSLVTIPGI